LITYDPLWKTMEEKDATTYTLQIKGGVSSSTIRRMKANQSVSTNTLDALCSILNCELHDVARYVPDGKRSVD
jgi:DNA-binding Xre family transcriptional regulator